MKHNFAPLKKPFKKYYAKKKITAILLSRHAFCFGGLAPPYIYENGFVLKTVQGVVNIFKEIPLKNVF